MWPSLRGTDLTMTHGHSVALQQVTRLVQSLGVAAEAESEGPADDDAAEKAVDGDEPEAEDAAEEEVAEDEESASPLDSEDFLLEPGK